MKRKLQKLLVVGCAVLLVGCQKETFETIALVDNQQEKISFKDAVVHDPSVIQVGEKYYIFGSHLAVAYTEDLMNWKTIASGVKKNNKIIPDAMNEMPEAFKWAQTATFWAPDVVQLEDGRYYMYYCNCEGSKPLACLGIAVADDIEGPYKDLGIILKSGMTDTPSENGDFYDATVYPNAVDPCVFYDAEGKLWMMYGSYSGGIYILELNKTTGFPLESGYGKKILGENHLRIEGPYVIYNPDTQYYYLFLSYGGLTADGGYNMRVCRSKNPDGPYYDANGTDMIECKGAKGTFFDDEAAKKYGVKLMGNYKWLWEEGEQGEKRRGLVSPGHNSVLYKEDTNQYFTVFHTRFEGKGEAYEDRVHQIYFNEEDWPVIVPYRYTGEEKADYEEKEIVGPYKLINHGRDISADIKTSKKITLYSNHTINGDYKGKWKLTDDGNVYLTIDGVIYKGFFVKAYDEFGEKNVMTFTALSEDGVAIWGSGLEAK